MPVIAFTHDFDWAPPEFNGRWLKAYKAGWTGLVTTPCAIAAVASGKAQKIGSTEKPGGCPAEARGDPTGGAKRSKTGTRTKR